MDTSPVVVGVLDIDAELAEKGTELALQLATVGSVELSTRVSEK